MYPLNPSLAGPANGYFSQLIPPERIFPDDTFPVLLAMKKNHLLQICFAIFISQFFFLLLLNNSLADCRSMQFFVSVTTSYVLFVLKRLRRRNYCDVLLTCCNQYWVALSFLIFWYFCFCMYGIKFLVSLFCVDH